MIESLSALDGMTTESKHKLIDIFQVCEVIDYTLMLL